MVIQVSDLLQDELCENVPAKITFGTNNNEEMNTILNVAFKQEYNTNLLCFYVF